MGSTPAGFQAAFCAVRYTRVNWFSWYMTAVTYVCDTWLMCVTHNTLMIATHIMPHICVIGAMNDTHTIQMCQLTHVLSDIYVAKWHIHNASHMCVIGAMKDTHMIHMCQWHSWTNTLLFGYATLWRACCSVRCSMCCSMCCSVCCGVCCSACCNVCWSVCCSVCCKVYCNAMHHHWH